MITHIRMLELPYGFDQEAASAWLLTGSFVVRIELLKPKDKGDKLTSVG